MNIIEHLLPVVPQGEEKCREVLQNLLHRMGFVTQEAFNVQAKVLARTREKLEKLEQEIQELEARIR